MNLVVIGSCTDSSHLAKELNRRLNNSIVVRIDLLKNIKNLILPGMSLPKSKDLGCYIGDVESYDYSSLNKEDKENIASSISTVFNGIKKAVRTSKGTFVANTFDALSNGIPTSTYSFIKVYSGAVDDHFIRQMIGDKDFLANTVFVKINSTKDLLLPVSISTSNLETLREGAFSYVESETVNEVLTSDVFKLLFELNDNPQKESSNDQTDVVIDNEPEEFVMEEEMDMAA